MVAGEKSNIDPEMAIEEQQLSDETRDLLSCLIITYWGQGPFSRRQYVEKMHQNELRYQGKEPAKMTEKEYQEFLETFDFWEDEFGPIPYWAESRHWYPEKCYEVVPLSEKADITVEKVGLKEVYVSKAQRDMIQEEAKEWVLVKKGHYKETLYWHDDDKSEWDGTSEIEDYYKRQAVIRDGHFAGALLYLENTSSMGMAVHKSSEYGILFTDGTTVGRIEEYLSHNSTEVDREEDSVYSLKRKE